MRQFLIWEMDREGRNVEGEYISIFSQPGCQAATSCAPLQNHQYLVSNFFQTVRLLEYFFRNLVDKKCFQGAWVLVIIVYKEHLPWCFDSLASSLTYFLINYMSSSFYKKVFLPWVKLFKKYECWSKVRSSIRVGFSKEKICP